LELFGKAYWSLYVLHQSRRQRKIPFLPREELEAIQRARLRAIIAHAYHTVPYYRSTMDQLGLIPSDFQSAEDLAKLPLLTKEQVNKNPRLFISEDVDPSSCVTLKSAGTTGLHASILHDPNAMLFNMASAGRELDPIVRKVGKPLVLLREATIIRDSGVTHTIQRFYHSRTFVPFKRLVLSGISSLEDNLSLINRFKPNILTGNGTQLGILIQQVLERKLTMHRPKVIVYYAAHFPEHIRALVEEQLEIPVYSCYGSAEVPRIGFSCEQRNGFHLHTDLCHVSVLSNEGTQGEIVVSNLTNRAMVLLNYRLGDIVSLSERPCPCGRTFPLLEKLIGRSDEVILLPDRRIVTPFDVYKVFLDRKDVLNYQVIQEEVEGFVIKVIPYKVRDFRQTEEELQGAFEGLFGHTARVTVEPVESIPPLPNGKMRRISALAGGGPAPSG
jgi:phenylacetate-CoA ligase